MSLLAQENIHFTCYKEIGMYIKVLSIPTYNYIKELKITSNNKRAKSYRIKAN